MNSALHLTLAEALNAGKHVFTEKPIGHEVKEVYEVYDLAKERGKHLLTGEFNSRVVSVIASRLSKTL